MIEIICLIILVVSNVITWKLTQQNCSKTIMELKSKAIQLKTSIEEAIKDRRITAEEYDNLRNAAINLEETILKE